VRFHQSSLKKITRSYTGRHEALSSKGLCLIDGKSIELEGTVELETFAGPPNYESIKNDDKEFRYWILTSKEPITCAYSYSIENEKLVDSKGSYSRFQIVDGNSQLYREAQEAGREISVTSTLMTGHHQTSFLLIVK